MEGLSFSLIPNSGQILIPSKKKDGGHPLIEATALFVASLIVDGVYGVLGQSASTAV